MEKKNILGRWMLMLLTAVMMPLQALADNSTNSTLSIEEFDIQAGETKEMLIDVNNPDQEVTMVEFYMQLPDGITVAEQNNEMLVDIVGRTTWKKHSLEVKTTNGSTHVLLYSGSNAILTGTSGAVISITLTASSTFNGGTIQLKRQLLTSPDKTESKPADYTYTIQGSEPQIPELNDGDVFTATNADGVEMTFEVISAADRTCMVRRRGMETHTIVTKPVPESVTIPAEVNGFKVVSIGYNAFYYCRSKSIIISEGVTSIGSFAFEGARLTDITIPKSMTNIEGGAFDDSNTSKNVYISDLSAWCKIKFEDSPLLGGHLFLNGEEVKDLVIPGDVTSLGDRNDMSLGSPFDGCVGLTSVTIPSTLTDIGYWGGFSGCPGIGSMIVESGNTVYDSRNNCNAIIETATATLVSGCKNTVIPNGIVAIGENAFSGCSGLTSITIPSSVTSVDPWSFRGCSNLTSVTVLSEEPVTIYSEFPNAANATLYVPKGSKAAYEAADYWKDFKEILEIEDETPEEIITFADLKVKAICVANWDTSGDGKLSKKEAAAVTSIGDVFMGNSEITSFDELQYFTGLTTIPDYAFSGCGALKSIRLPKSLTSIGEYAFEDCTSLETVVSFIETLFELGEGAFCAWENDRLKFDLHFSLYVPIGTKGLYRAAGWDVDENDGDYRTILSGTPENPGSFTVDGIVYDPIDATTVELIDGKNTSGDITIPSMVANGDVSYQVTEIGACAFKGNTSLTSIVIPNCVKAIRPLAFNGCTGLTTVTSYIETPFYLGDIKGVFLNNENVVYATYLQFTLYVPAGTKSLYEEASWTDVSRIVEMGGENPEDIITFADSNVKSICVANWDTDGDGQLSKTEAAAVTSIGTVFKNSNITSFDELQYFTGLTEIEGRAFNNCQLTSVTIPNGVKTIGDAAFSQNEIASVSLPNTLESIGKYAFASNKLQSITIPQKVTTIEEGTFYNNELQSVSILGKVTAIGKDAFTYYQKITSFSISDLVSWCGMNADWYRDSNKGEKCCFYVNGHEVTDLVIPDGVTFIGKYTFMGLSGLTSLTIPEGVTSIQNSAFLGCIGLTSVTLPKSLTSIGDFVFQDSKGIATVTALMTEPFDFDPDASTFHYTIFDNAILYVPAGTKSLYKNAEGWKEFKNIVEMENGSPEDIITFADSNVKALCVANWDTSGDGELSKAEAAAVTSLDEVFKNNQEITSFDELQYFTGLTTIGLLAFDECSSLTSVIIPNSVTTMAYAAFDDCSSLSSVIIPSSVTSIAKHAFWSCSGLTSVTSLIENPFDIDDDTFPSYVYSDATLHVPVGTLNQYKDAAGWKKFTRTVEGESKEIVVDGLKYLCLVATKTATVIDDDSYSDLTEVVIPESITDDGMNFTVTAIDKRVFIRNYNLAKVELPSTLTSIGSNAFTGCYNLMSVVSRINPPIHIEDNMFGLISAWNSEIRDYEYNDPSKATLYVPAGSKSKYEAITGWTKFAKIEEGELTTVENIVYLCNSSSMTATVIQDVGYKDLTKVTIQKSVAANGNSYIVTAIDKSAFAGCDRLVSVISRMDSPINIDENTFLSEATLYVPVGSKSEYEAIAGWTEFAKIVEGEPKETKVGNYRYSCEESGLTATVIPDEGYKDLTEVEIPSEVQIDDTYYRVTAIANYAFEDCDNITSVVLPEGLEWIGSCAINGCSIESLTLPSTITYIGENAFYNQNLTDVYSKIKNPFVLSDQCFTYQEVEFYKEDGMWHDRLVIIDANVTLYVPIGTKEQYEAVGGWDQFATINEGLVGDKFTAVNADGVELTFQVISTADKTCEVARQGKDRNTIVTSPYPESITIPAEANGFKVVSIGYQAFYGAKGIKSVVIPEGVTSINTQAFRECYNLASFTFPKSLKECGTDSFEDCAFGAMVHISDLESWCNVSLASWDLYGWHLFLNGEEVKDLVIPNGVTSIGESMELVSPLTNCASLTSVTIPASVTKMYVPFSGCSSLTSVTTFAEEPVAIFTDFPNATNSITNATLYVPKGSKAAYEAADYWKDFKEIVEVTFGDADGDGDVTPEDVELVKEYIMTGNSEGLIFTNADTNGNKQLNVVDIVKMINIIKNKKSTGGMGDN